MFRFCHDYVHDQDIAIEKIQLLFYITSSLIFERSV